MNAEELALIATMKAGVRYTEYHQQMHYRIASLLLKHQLVNGISAEAMVKEDLTGPLCLMHRPSAGLTGA